MRDTPAGLSKISHVAFSHLASRIAATVASWAADCLDLPEKRERPMRREPGERFLRDMRQRLDWLEEAAFPPPPPEVIERAGRCRAGVKHTAGPCTECGATADEPCRGG